MRISDIQKGQPAVAYKDTQANIEAITSTEGMYAYATDIQKFGYYTTVSGWIWRTEASSGISSITVKDNDTTLSGITTLEFSGASVSTKSPGSTTAIIVISGGSGSGDMLKSEYDTDNDGIVDTAEKIYGVDTAGNLKYYGTNSAGTVGFYTVPSGGSSSGATDILMIQVFS